MNSPRSVWLIHIAVWTVIVLSPLMFMNNGEGISPAHFAGMCIVPLSLMIVFYVNYLWLTPYHFANGDKRFYWGVNTILILAIGIGLHIWMESTKPDHDEHPERFEKEDFKFIFLVLRNMFNLAVSVAIATTVQLSMRWHASEAARREAEVARANAELSNLKAQVNPHFLLNTLNNIYALVEFDAKLAQEAILELSKLLRHVLYDNEQRYVDLESEVQFIHNYVSLMKIRLAPSVDVKVETNIEKPYSARIAPLIFISLIENAFKHGISATKPSFIHIRIDADSKNIICLIRNSNHPKDADDRSGHGIGLQQVAKRLELMYPNQYEWEKGSSPDGKEYSSKITIHDTKMRSN